MRISHERIKGVGGRILEFTLGVFLLAMLVAVLGGSESQAGSLTNSLSNANTAVPLNSAGCLPASGTACIVDDSNGNQLSFDLSTGAYTFTNCMAFNLTGTGKVTISGCIVTLEHIALDRRVVARIDFGAKRATASARTYSPAMLKTISDRNTANNVCGCMMVGG
ncbi:MAG TPA: hypothetical protein VJH03_03905 [Blastocatellia bacterium]|nr:hypothetical protein [Blastocatellia bacterium]